MRRLSCADKVRNLNRSKYRLNELKKQFRRRRKAAVARRIAIKESLKMPVKRLIAPRVFGLHDPQKREDLLRFIHKLQEASQSYQRIQLDFSATELMVSDGALYFLANLDSLLISNPSLHISLKYPENIIVEQVLQQIGIIGSIKARKRLVGGDSFESNVKYWRYATCNRVDASQAQSIFDAMDGLISGALSKKVFAGVTEAMTNCTQHAYEDDSREEKLQKWWMFSQEKDGKLSVLICDLGIGIPASLYKANDKVDIGWSNRLISFLEGRDDDGYKIKAAIKIGKSRTKLKNRGKGLNQMVYELDQYSEDQACIKIYSSKGIYQNRYYNKNKILIDKETVSSYKDGIEGTLVCWSLPLNELDMTT